MLDNTVLVAATVATGLSAGLFYAFFFSVMPGLRLGDDRTFVEAMRGINVAILNGWFALVFAGSPILIALAGVLHLGEGRFLWIVAAFVLYVVALFVTFGLNIPLNNALAESGEHDVSLVRKRFEAPWTRANNLRTLIHIASFACLAWALTL